MIKNIITYPDSTGVEYAADIRVFDEALHTFIDDLKETAQANNLEGLAAAQVGSYYNVLVIKKDGEFLELLNPRILNKKGLVTTRESTAYFPGVSTDMQRYESISLVYEDREGESHSLKADGEFAVILQRKIDYLFGATFLTKLKDDKRDAFEALLNSNGISCPTPKGGFSRDYFVKAANYLMIAMLLFLALSLFVDIPNTWDYQLTASFVVVGINISYTLYSYYENKRFSICTNCYNMSIFGVVVIGLVRLTLLMTLSYFLMA